MIIRPVGSLEGLSVVTPSYRGFRFPSEIISPCGWLYHRFNPSLRDIEELSRRARAASAESKHAS
ncbi:hypothetical protein OH738_25240 [Streptomyces hirsutus]|uniref:hypothetical protein n=1 Tax=Streptomyces hirsutus TaxID=35620 RepID=UPI00386ECD4C|nr:hypothetical protein OH738_25240 [Streptomyces hirsutus]